ncbi:phage major capsid protein [Crossiella sp. SN42]|uniref:phage major capsid protein n=1 Tax=Crossiella sp. SN42 TaxID=2944808 RepID=UPI00207C6EE8|nr:phage major capsid protein [Crossiella sp. SN42]MCO1575358.1 phage major capsid protein [Crossiella sp. SN42]
MPEEVSNQIIAELPQQSVLMARARRGRMSRKKSRQPVLSALPDAYWVNGDTGLKQTTKAEWANLIMVAEELAALVVIPDAYFDDADVPLWDEIRPLLTEAIGRKIDQAGIFGIDKPASWPTALVPGAVAAGNVVTAGTGVDLAQDIAALGEAISVDGFAVNGFGARPGLNWRLTGLRSAQGVPIYHPALSQTQPATLYGYPLNEVTNGSWVPTAAELIAGDWTKALIAPRQDITFTMFSEGVISDETGKVIINLMQQDSKALRVVMRVGFAIANPVTRTQPNAAARFPFGVLAPKPATP